MTSEAGTGISGTLSGSGQCDDFEAQSRRVVMVSLRGAWVGTVQVQRSYDRGHTWFDMTMLGEEWGRYTANCDEPVDEAPNDSIRYRLDFARVSGTLEYRIGH